MHGIGIIGLGIMGRRMAEAIAAHPDLRIVAGFDPHPHRDLSGVLLKDGPAAVIQDPLVDCVYIATPPVTHAEFVARAAAAGKAIFCEKPLAASVAEASACIDSVRASAVAAAVNFPFASAPPAIHLREIVAGGELGEIKAASLALRFAQWPRGWQTGASGWLAGAAQGGFTREVASHFLFLANRIFGPAILGETSIARGAAGTETSVRAVVHYQSVKLTIDASVAGDVEDHNRFEVTGTRGNAALTDWYRLEHGTQLSERAPPMSHQLDALARMLSGASDHGLATFDEAAAVVELVEGILARTPARPN